MAMGVLLGVCTLLTISKIVHEPSASTVDGGNGLQIAEAPTILGALRFGNKSLVRGSRYPDDHDLTLQNPNAHATRIAAQVPVHAVQRAQTRVDLFDNGLEFIDTSNLPGLARVASKLARSASLSEQDRDIVVSAFSFHCLPIHRGHLLVLHVAPAGLALRFVGPGGEGQFDPDLATLPTWQPLAHADQDVHGEPIHTLMGGLAPLVFHPLSPLQLLNIWLPTQQLVCQPLVVMDLASLDAARSRHQYHIYARDDLGERLNDCWAFSHDDSQRWFSLGDAWCVPNLFAMATKTEFRRSCCATTGTHR